MGKDKLQRKSWRAAHKTPEGWNSSRGDLTQYSLLLDSLRDTGGTLATTPEGLRGHLRRSEPLPAGHCEGTPL